MTKKASTRGRGGRVAVALVLATCAALGPVAASDAAPAPAPRATATVTSEWPQFRGGPTHTGAVVDSALTRSALSHLTPSWRMTGVGGLVVSGGVGYLFEVGGVVAIRVSDASELWHASIPAAAYAASSLSVSGGVLVVAEPVRVTRRRLGESVWGVEAATGRVLWQRSYPTASWSPPTLAGQSVLVAYGKGMEKLDLATGAVAWTSTRPTQSSPAVDGNTVVVAQNVVEPSYDVHGVDLTTGATTWVRPLTLPYPDRADALTAKGVAYTASGRGIVANRLPNGSSPWKASVGSYGVALAGDQLVTAGDGTTGLDRRTGATTWHVAQSTGTVTATDPVVVGDTMVVATAGAWDQPYAAALEMRDTATGALVGSLDLRTVVPGANSVDDLIVAEGHVFVHVFDGHQWVLLALAPA